MTATALIVPWPIGLLAYIAVIVLVCALIVALEHLARRVDRHRSERESWRRLKEDR